MIMKVLAHIIIFLFCLTFAQKANASNYVSNERVEALVKDSAETDSLDALVENRNPKRHMTFMGIPITGTIDQFSAKLKAKGISCDYKVSARLDKGIRAFCGTFMGETYRTIVVNYNPYTKIVYEVMVFLGKCTYTQAWNKYIKNYPMLVNKYQEELLCTEEGDGDNKAKYAFFHLEDGDIALSLSYEDNEYEYYNVVCYTDLINKRKNKSVNDQKVYNDL